MSETTGYETVLDDLVIANRILASEGVIDAFGHISIRHPRLPDRYFLARSRSPELVERGVPFPSAVFGDGGEDFLAAAAELGFPVALKAMGLLHKTEAGGVELDLPDPTALQVAAARIDHFIATDGAE